MLPSGATKTSVIGSQAASKTVRSKASEVATALLRPSFGVWFLPQPADIEHSVMNSTPKPSIFGELCGKSVPFYT
jgi:hypothetical protein